MPLRILLFADFRIPHAQGMARGLRDAGHIVLSVSSEMVSAEIAEPPTSRLSRQRGALRDLTHDDKNSTDGRTLRRLARWGAGHTLIALALLPARRRQLQAAIRRFAPDIVHGLRLPYEGLTVLTLKTAAPRVVSTWGSDFEPAVRRDLVGRRWMTALLPRAAGIHVDSMENLNRARSLGLDPRAPWIYAAANFGFDETLFHPHDDHETGLVVFARRPASGINYRGFVSAALSLRPRPQLRIVPTNLREVESELRHHFGADVTNTVELLPRLDQPAFADLLRTAHVVVSPTLADGTPGTVVEALARGARVVAGRLPQLEAMNQPPELLMLVDAADAVAIAEGNERCLDLGVPDTRTSPPAPFSRAENEARLTEFYRNVLHHRQ